MQQPSLNWWEEEDEPGSCREDKEEAIIHAFITRAYSPMGMALTHVLLSLNRKNTQLNLRDFPEMLPNLCLVGMNFHLSGVDEKARNWSDLNLSEVDFRAARLENVQFKNSQLSYARFEDAKLQDVELQNADLRGCDLSWWQLEKVKDGGLIGSKITIYDFKDKIYPEWKAETDSKWGALTEGERVIAIQKFHDETGMYVFNECGNQIIP